MEHAVDIQDQLETPFKVVANSGSSWPRGVRLRHEHGTCVEAVSASHLGYEYSHHAPTGAMVWVIDNGASNEPTILQIAELMLPTPDRQDSALPWRAEVQRLQSVLGLPVTALTDALQVSRPTFYGWLRGEMPNRSNQERIGVLAQIARVWASLNVGPMSRYWNLPAPSAGAQLRSTLTSSDLTLDRFNADVTRLGIGKRLLPLRASKPRSSARVADGRLSRPFRRAWGNPASGDE